MDFRKLNGASFKLWIYFCTVCKQREGGIAVKKNRFIRGGCIQEISFELDYNPQTISQAIHILKNAGFLTEIHDSYDSKQYTYFLHVILMGEYITLPSNAEQLARQAMEQYS